jgi:hypothetical protein
VDGVAHRAREMVAGEFAVELHVADHRLDRRTPAAARAGSWG